MKERNEIFEEVVSNIYGCFDRALARKNATGFASNDSLIDSSWKIKQLSINARLDIDKMLKEENFKHDQVSKRINTYTSEVVKVIPNKTLPSVISFTEQILKIESSLDLSTLDDVKNLNVSIEGEFILDALLQIELVATHALIHQLRL